MPPRKVKIEFYDDGGTRHTLSLEGSLTKEKVLRVLDYVELMGRLPSVEEHTSTGATASKFDRVRDLATTGFRETPFNSQDLEREYRDRYGEAIPLSTVSTYLSRLVDRGLLDRSGSSAAWTYIIKRSGTFSWSSVMK